MELLTLIEIKKQELQNIMKQKDELEKEIRELVNKADKELCRLLNYKACYNPVVYKLGDCKGCHFYQACQFIRKK